MPETINVTIGKLQVAKDDTVLSTSSLGSCIALMLYDRKEKIGGLAYAMHAESSGLYRKFDPSKCVDTALDEMIEKMKDYGSTGKDLEGYLVGGACMFSSLEKKPAKNIGLQNVLAAEKAFNDRNISITARDTGDNYGRRVLFNIENGIVIVKSLHGEKQLSP